MEIEKKPVLAVIRQKYDQMSSAERKVADFILMHQDIALESNVSELAQGSGVSDATVIRMCHRLGYKGYYQLRLMMAKDIGSDSGDSGENVESTEVQKVFHHYAMNMESIGANLSQETMNQAVKLISGARMVHVVAVGNTNPLAQYISFRLGRMGIRCMAEASSEYFLNQINLGDSGDVIVAVSKSGLSRNVIQAVELGRKKGMKVIAVTAYKLSPLSELADCVLISAGRRESFSYYKDYAHLNETAVADALMDSIMNWDKNHRTSAMQLEEILAESKI